MLEELTKATGLSIYDRSVCRADRATFFLARRGTEKLVGCLARPCLPDAEKVAEIDGRCVCVGPTSHANADALRRALPWTAPKCLGLSTSIGLGDRLGLATPGHVRALRAGGRGIKAALAQQSSREMARTRRSPEEVIDAATWGVFQEGFAEGFGADADHLQTAEDIDATAAAGFTIFTIDPGAHVVQEADRLDSAGLADSYASLDFETLEISPGDLKAAYAGKRFGLDGGGEIAFDAEIFLKAAVKYGSAIAHTVSMYRRLRRRAAGAFELEVSVDETESPTSAAEHYFIAGELKRLGVGCASIAPRFIGAFEKGVDYIGDLGAFRESFAEHVAVMRTLGPYKISIHSGSDKFSIYPIVAELTEGMVHLKTAGVSYLEALRTIAKLRPELFREILDFARRRYENDRATYHVSADAGRLPPAEALKDSELAALLDDFHARQVLHVTFGSVLTAQCGRNFRDRIREALLEDEEAHYSALARRLAKHIAPLAK
ncbi:MAG: tagaturonate epimerase family protein [Planctomycetota bacterium]|jgi:hypothetical protein